MSRPMALALEPQPPLCMICGDQVEHDGDRWRCENCRVSWRTAAAQEPGFEPREWDDPDAQQCESIDGRFLPGGCWSRSNLNLNLYRCLLTAGHDTSLHIYADHGGNRHCWDDADAATPEQIVTVRGLSHDRGRRSPRGHRHAAG